MRATREHVVIDDVTWHVTYVAPDLGRTGAERLGRVEFRSGSEVHEVDLEPGEIPSIMEFAATRPIHLAELLRRAREG